MPFAKNNSFDAGLAGQGALWILAPVFCRSTRGQSGPFAPRAGDLMAEFGRRHQVAPPEAPVELKARNSCHIPPMKVHDTRTEAAGAKVIAKHVVEKGKPLASPAN